ncbi:MAG TPA: HAD family hydrolase [Bacteroidales bacterium]|nr:HAD family hydrolase [Bacteroidales bacterium]
MKTLLILDIDETLLHSSYQEIQRSADLKFRGICIYFRPYLKEFLEACFKNYDVAVWSSARAEYVKYILGNLTGLSTFSFIKTRKNCRSVIKQPGLFSHMKRYYEKDINKVISHEKIIVIDDSPDQIKIKSGFTIVIPIKRYLGETDDTALKDLLKTICSKKNLK